MRTLIILFFCSIIFLNSCIETKVKKETKFIYNTLIDYPVFNSGDFWIEKFDQRGLQNAVIYDDKLYCNTIDVGGDQNFLYCLNLLNGLVVWRAQVDSYATQQVANFKDTIIYCSYLGNIYAFNSNGSLLWNNKYDRPFGGYKADYESSLISLITPFGSEVSNYEIKDGNLFSRVINDSLKRIIESKIEKNEISNKKYFFERNGYDYVIKSSGDVYGDVIIKISVNKN
ncbi:MAG: hypothetical protein ACPGVD_12590 [Flavobacteriales bacterium]